MNGRLRGGLCGTLQRCALAPGPGHTAGAKEQGDQGVTPCQLLPLPLPSQMPHLRPVFWSAFWSSLWRAFWCAFWYVFWRGHEAVRRRVKP